MIALIAFGLVVFPVACWLTNPDRRRRDRTERPRWHTKRPS